MVFEDLVSLTERYVKINKNKNDKEHDCFL